MLTLNLLKSGKDQKIISLQKQLAIYKNMALNASSIEVFRDAHNKISFINNALEFATGYAKEQLMQDHFWQQIIHPEDADKTAVLYHAIYADKTPINNFNFRIICHDKSLKHLCLSAVPMYDNGNFIGIHESFRDVTEGVILKEKLNRLKELERELKSQNHQFHKLNTEYQNTITELQKAKAVSDNNEKKLLQSQKELQNSKVKAEESSKLKTAFLNNLSHEIRTPMNAIVGFSEMIKLPEITENSRLKYANFIIDNSRQLLTIVNDLLTISTLEKKQERVKETEVCLNQFLSDLTKTFQEKYKNKEVSLCLSKTFPTEEACILIDKSKLEHILTRLLTNAYKYTNKGSIEVCYKIKKENIQFSVKDTGIGIEADNLETIFKRFSNAENTISSLYGGTGLGLAIAKGFVELLGGQIWVESIPNTGSNFFFTTPYKPSMQTTLKTTNTNGASVSTTKTVLIAEDYEYNFIFLEELLKNMAVKLIHARNGQEAIDIIDSQVPVDLILMDIKMPIIDGHAAALEIKKKRPKLPIIAQSAFALEHEKERFSGDAFDDYITKPIDKIRLISAIKKHITV